MTQSSPKFERMTEWVHVQYAEAASKFKEVYGFAGSQGMVNLEGVRMLPKGRPSKTLIVMMHPATALAIAEWLRENGWKEKGLCK